MTRKTFSKETKELMREGRIRIAVGVVLCLLGLAVWISARQYQNVNHQYEMAKSSERDIWDARGEK